ncbi:P-loop containing nucleoside triphosphate hydrolase protein [Polyporus arcularius HHB13444]|uniref:ATP-dependent DNA helicase n=1 Tax=Polyporus arcularius HHB13444 TaxID=1314778 RepID=A0A5C3PFQ2_9APHY|nr:P-loop containing nucleoside triphosphate hydrolase protein [Polyporus arcularius HHB13444]
MSSDEYFDDELDSAFLNEVDAIEAAHVSAPTATASRPTAAQPAPKSASKPLFKPAGLTKTAKITSSKPPIVHISPPDVIELHDSSSDYYAEFFDDFPDDDAALAQLDQEVERQLDEHHHNRGHSYGQPVAGPSNLNNLVRRPSRGAQLNLFGEVAKETEPASNTGDSNRRTFQRTRSTLRQMPLPGQAKRTKQWDRTAYAKTGWRKPKNTDKGKGRASDEEDEDEHIEFEQFPAPQIPAPPMKLKADRLAAKTWIYPLNKPKRDYQYNIVKNCLVENTLVALPTGLGKTFIAGVVMLNFYNWFPQGKVVFVAPTKPLVAQQIDACHKTCGIPGSAAIELTGNVAKARRIDAWRTKRVIYATPQTLLNDLINGHVDALDIVLIVIDEAHRGTGDYAYAQVVRYMMQHNPHFRILALTATPGGKPEVVQDIVDALHISHIEIRSESDPDLKKYLHTKHEQEHFVQMTEDIAVLRDALGSMMTPIIKKVQQAGFLKHGNVIPTMLHPFRCTATLQEMHKARAQQWAMSAVSQLGILARAMGYLLENSIIMCHAYLKSIVDATDNNNGKRAIKKMDAFGNLMRKFEEQAARGFSMHPKMDVLRTLLIDHFARELPDDAAGPDAQRRQSRAMVFVSFRECVEEIVELLSKESPIIRPKAFIGQGTDKQGKKGYAQTEQLKVIEDFKKGVYNVLVSTSIGEEGLDIGEVDLIVCYDAQKTPIRMLQRIGRTGRKASGTVHILLAKGREEHNWQKAQSNYAEVQHFIVRASDLEVYGDVDRMIPEDIEPECVEMEMDIEEYVREDRTSRKGSLAAGNSPKQKKRKRDDNPLRNVPVNAAKGFVSVTELLVQGGAKAKKKMANIDLEHADEDDSDDEEIEAGIFGPRRTKSTSAAVSSKGKKKGLARSATAAAPSAKAKKKKSAKQATLTQLDLNTSEDSDDEAIELGLFTSRQPNSDERKKSSQRRTDSLKGFQTAREFAMRSSSPEIPLNDSVIDITSSPEPPDRSARAMLGSSPERPLRAKRLLKRREISSPERPLKATSQSTSSGSQSKKSGRSSNPPQRSRSPSSPSVSAESPKRAAGDDSMAWLIEDDDDLVIPDASPEPSGPERSTRTGFDDEPLFLESSPVPVTSPLRLPSDDEKDEPLFLDESFIVDSSRRPNGRVVRISSPQRSGPSCKTRSDMGPPALPVKVTNSSPSFSAGDGWSPEPTFAVRAPGNNARKRAAADVIDVESSPLAPPPPSQRRLQRERPRSPSPVAADGSPVRPPRKKKRKFQDAAEVRRYNPWIDLEATHSGDELSAGPSDADTQVDSDDQMFLDEPGKTQIDPSYDQSAIYRQSLLTQIPGAAGPVFGNRPVRRGQAAFGPNGAGPSRYGRRRSSSPLDEDDEPDEYVTGSFVVDDDADISLLNEGSSEM